MHSQPKLIVSTLVLTVLLCTAAGLTPAAAQEPSPGVVTESAQAGQPATDQEESDIVAPRGVFEEAIQVKIVNVRVFVRDKKGNPITGLKKDDFVLLENKKEMPITNFYEVTGGKRTDRKEKESPRLRDGVPVRAGFDPRAQQVPEDERLHLVVYVDHFNIKPFNRNRVFRFVREFLRTHVDRSDRVMLMSYNRSPKVERPFTSDPIMISNALYGLEKHTGGRMQTDSEARDLLRDIDEARDPLQMESRIRLYAENVYNDLQFSLDGLKETVMSLAGIPGRKAILYVSDGLPMRAGEEFFYAADDKIRQSAGDGAWGGAQANILESLQYDASRRFRDLTNHANANDVAFYAIDAAGLRTSSITSAESGSYNTQFSTTFETVKVQNLQSSLLYMADRTGGQAVVNTNNFSKGFDRFATDFEHYYSLGYSPGHAGSGRSYNIEVKVNRKGVRVRHREGYRDKSIETEMADRTLASLRYGYENNELGVKVQRGEEIRRRDGTYVVHVDLHIPIGELALIQGADQKHQGKVRVWVQAADDKGTSEVQTNVVAVEIPSNDLERATQSFYVFTMPLVMRGGEQRLAFGVRDDMTSRTSFMRRVISVGG